MKPLFTVTYGLVTPESAEYGDYAETGWLAPGDYRQQEPDGWTLREAFDRFSGYGAEADCSPWSEQYPPSCLNFYGTNDGTREYYETGVDESATLHFPRGITRASAVRIARLFRAYGYAHG